MKLKKIIREKESFESQIIYGLPFINIIEQGLNEYNKVFKDIDVKRATKAKERAEKRLAAKTADTDLVRAEIALKRSIQRINIKATK